MQYNTIHKKVTEADIFIKQLFFTISPLYKEEFAETKKVTIPLFVALHSSSESILVLLQNQAVFDADILLRCIMEGTMKYCYLMTGTKDEQSSKCKEYRVVLHEMERLADHKKATEAVRILRSFSQNNTGPFETMLMSDEEESLLSRKYPSSKRNEYSRKWSYQFLLKELAKNHVEYEAQLGTILTYANTSHYCHFDWTCISSRNEQIMSSVNRENEFYDYVHGLRILSNVLSMYLFRVMEFMRGNNYGTKELGEKCLQGFELVSKLDQEQNQLLRQVFS